MNAPAMHTPASHLRLSLVFVAAALFHTSAAEAATAAFTSALPTANVLQKNAALSASANIQVRNISATGARWVGVGFTAPTNSTLARMTFHIAFDEGGTKGKGLFNSPAQGATMKIDIVALDTTTGAPSTPFTPIHSETATLPSVYSNQPYITFELAAPVSLTAKRHYGIVLSFTEFASQRGINLRQSPGATAGTNGIGSLFYTSDAGATYTTTGAPLAFLLETPPAP